MLTLFPFFFDVQFFICILASRWIQFNFGLLKTKCSCTTVGDLNDTQKVKKKNLKAKREKKKKYFSIGAFGYHWCSLNTISKDQDTSRMEKKTKNYMNQIFERYSFVCMRENENA